MRNNIVNIFYFLILMIPYWGCTSFLKTPAIPTNNLDISSELNHIFHTDQKDRKQNILRFIFLSNEKIMKNNKTMAISDH